MRNCDGCTKCCEGWLSGKAKGILFYAGMPCHFKSGKGCSIYEDRPENPCKIFECQWKIDPTIPEWMKPDQINAIFVKRHKNGIDYIKVVEAGGKLQVEVLNWMIQNFLAKNINVEYDISGGLNYAGSDEFVKTYTNTNTQGEL